MKTDSVPSPDAPFGAEERPFRTVDRRSVPWAWASRLMVLVCGLIALAVGIGLGPRHYAKEGLSLTAAAGLLILALGLAATGWAAIRVFAATRRRWWPLLVVSILVLTYLALWTLGQAVAAAYAPRPALGDETPADLGLTYREVTFAAGDGVDMAGWYMPTRNGAAVAVMHGAGSTRSGVLRQAAVLAEHGYGVLLFDARGHGESSGRAMDFGWYGELDASGAVDFLERQPGVASDRIGLVGVSMGGEQAIGAAGVDERVAAVVAEGATSRVAADKAYLDEYGARGRLQQWIDRGTYWFTDLLSDAPRPDSLRRSVSIATTRPTPTDFLLISAGEMPDEELAADHLRAGHPGSVQTWVVRGAGHTQGLRTSPVAWEEHVIAFLDDSLAGEGG